jgi:hypothetical protein
MPFDAPVGNTGTSGGTSGIDVVMCYGYFCLAKLANWLFG